MCKDAHNQTAEVQVNSTGVVGCGMIGRTVVFAHVKDLDSIPDDKARKAALETNLRLAKQFIIDRQAFTSGAAYRRLCETIS